MIVLHNIEIIKPKVPDYDIMSVREQEQAQLVHCERRMKTQWGQHTKYIREYFERKEIWKSLY
jgi:hypothetical protein